MKGAAGIFLVGVLFLATCSSPAAETSAKGSFRVEMKVEGGEFKEGGNRVEITLKDTSGSAVTGAVIKITPWMPSMGHGTPWTSKVTETGKGVYRSNIPLTMGGHWEIRLHITAGGVEDTVVFDFPSVKGKE